MIDSYGVGDTVAVSFDVKGRDWTDKSGQTKYFNTLEAYRISGQQRAAVKGKQMEEDTDDDDDIFRSLGIDTSPKKSTAKVDTSWSDDDLPF
jgi:single-stranded DNA-binding protein